MSLLPSPTSHNVYLTTMSYGILSSIEILCLMQNPHSRWHFLVRQMFDNRQHFKFTFRKLLCVWAVSAQGCHKPILLHSRDQTLEWYHRITFCSDGAQHSHLLHCSTLHSSRDIDASKGIQYNKLSLLVLMTAIALSGNLYSLNYLFFFSAY